VHAGRRHRARQPDPRDQRDAADGGPRGSRRAPARADGARRAPALDDFGTGFSSLAYLRNFPVDALKIDGVGDPDPDDHALVRAIISLGLTFDLRVVAEGIEDEDQRRELVRLGCDRGPALRYS